VSNILLQNFQEKKDVFYCESSYYNYRTHEVPIEIFRVQNMLESLEGSGKSCGTMKSEGRSHPLVVGKRVGGLELVVEN